MDPLTLTRKQIVLLAVVVEVGFGIAALAAGWLFGLPVAGWIEWNMPAVLQGLGGALALLAILILCLRFPVGPIGRLMRLVDESVRPLFRECRVIDLLLISVLAGIGEELFFRGFLQSWLEPHFGSWFGAPVGRWSTVAVVSVLFGVAHCISREYMVFATTLGFLLGALAIVTGGLLAPIVAHAAYDFVALLILTRRHREAPQLLNPET